MGQDVSRTAGLPPDIMNIYYRIRYTHTPMFLVRGIKQGELYDGIGSDTALLEYAGGRVFPEDRIRSATCGNGLAGTPAPVSPRVR